MNFNANQEQDETAIELTPLIDVVFLLLIFFMISTTFTKETALRINLPEGGSEAAQNEPFTVEVQVGQQSQYAIQTSDTPNAQSLVNSNRDTLIRALSAYKDRESVLLVVRADRLATHEAVIKVLDVAQELDMTNITFATKQVNAEN
ncbi:MAG TPA: biopolymer transporter ExbD [Gammaproteobacteria bacterium]|nr:biopolymer transporter ExbD [Gammaproteobacteria bacterium]